MKRFALLSLCLLLFAVLCACAVSPGMDLSGFLQTRREIGAPLDPARLYRTESDDGEQFFLPLSQTLSLRLLAAQTGALYECRVLLQKRDLAGGSLPLDAAAADAFRAECAATLRAFCGLAPAEAEQLLRALAVFADDTLEKTGALTVRSGAFVLTLQSHPLETVLSARDTRLREVPPSSVPESRPAFGDTTATRRETVPHR